MLRSIDPATDEVLGEVDEASASTVKQAFDAARRAQSAWGERSVADRCRIADRFRREVLDRRDEAALLVSREGGKPVVEALMADVLTTLEHAKHTVRHAPAALRPQLLRLGNPLLLGRRSWLQRQPVGVVGVISPWNYPLAIPATGVITALVAGNGVVLKPSEKTPLVGQWLAGALHRAGVPEDVLHVVHGRQDAGRALVDEADAVTFTGSVAVGKAVGATCDQRGVPVCLELGGKDPMVVLPGAHEDGVVSGATWGAFTNAGQTCASVERLYVPRAEQDHLVGRLVSAADALRVGPGTADVDMGPVIDDASVRRIMGHIKDAEKRGATVATGGDVIEELGSRFIAPTVLTGVDHSMRCMREETFGPTLPVMAYDETVDGVNLANDSSYGLTASVWGPRPAARQVAQHLQAGTVMVNECVYTYAAPETPWSGWKDSGRGQSHGPTPYDVVTRQRHLHEAPGRTDQWHYPYSQRLSAFLDGGMRFLHRRSVAGGVAALRRLRRARQP